MYIRGGYDTNDEQFFTFRHKVAVSQGQIRKVLKNYLTNLGLDASIYHMHSMRAGRASDMIKSGAKIKDVKICG